MPEHLSISAADADRDAKQGRRKPARRCRAKRRGPPGWVLKMSHDSSASCHRKWRSKGAAYICGWHLWQFRRGVHE
jgi:hypothetical protein